MKLKQFTEHYKCTPAETKKLKAYLLFLRWLKLCEMMTR